MVRENWEFKVEVWERMALGEDNARIGRWLDERKHHLDRQTIAALKKELLKLDESNVGLLPLNVQHYRLNSLGPIKPGEPSDSLPENNAVPETTAHQAQLREMIEHIMGYLSGLRPAAPLTAKHPLQQLPVEDDPAYQALKEHCGQSELWQLFDSYMKFENDRFHFCQRQTIAENAQAISFQMTHAGQRIPDEIRKEEEWNSLRKRHSEVCNCIPETRLRLAKWFKELLLCDKVPGDCRWCPE